MSGTTLSLDTYALDLVPTHTGSKGCLIAISSTLWRRALDAYQALPRPMGGNKLHQKNSLQLIGIKSRLMDRPH
jgi:hypothetical protein